MEKDGDKQMCHLKYNCSLLHLKKVHFLFVVIPIIATYYRVNPCY